MYGVLPTIVFVAACVGIPCVRNVPLASRSSVRAVPKSAILTSDLWSRELVVKPESSTVGVCSTKFK